MKVLIWIWKKAESPELAPASYAITIWYHLHVALIWGRIAFVPKAARVLHRIILNPRRHGTSLNNNICTLDSHIISIGNLKGRERRYFSPLSHFFVKRRTWRFTDINRLLPLQQYPIPSLSFYYMKTTHFLLLSSCHFFVETQLFKKEV